jgi:hypothetical protein
MQEYSNSEVKRIQEILIALEKFTELEADNVQFYLEELQ